MIEITKNLYQGDVNDAIQASQQKTVDAIIYLGQAIPRELSHESKIPIFHVPLKDGDNNHEISIHMILANIVYLNLTLHDNKTLVACRAGISRSPTLVAAYLSICKPEELDFEKALKYMYSINTSYQPEPNFLEIIRKFANSYWGNEF